MNTLMQNLTNAANVKYTENGGLAHSSTNRAVYDLFALGGAYRSRSDEDVILLFKKAYDENAELAMKCLFYLRDVRGGTGERRFFRVIMKWLAQYNDTIEAARRNLQYVAEYGRYDDLYCFVDTKLEAEMFQMLKTQLALDVQCETPSLLAKWLKSENASSNETRTLGRKTREAFGMTARQYRKTLSILRERINVLERLMSAGRWKEIEFDKIPSKAGLIYRNAFARRDIIKAQYEAFAKDENTKVNATTLYPADVVHQARQNFRSSLQDPSRLMVNKYWENLPDYLNGAACKMMCVVDTSGSMTWGSGSILPIEVATSLGMYCAERVGGDFKNHYIAFSRDPRLVKIEGVDFVDKVKRIEAHNLCENTDLIKTFKFLRDMSLKANPEDRLDTIVVISDMEIDGGSHFRTNNQVITEIEMERLQWEALGMKMPSLVYWNVDARHDTILDLGPNVSLVSGYSPIIFQQVLTGKTGWDLCLDKLLSERYADIH